MVVAIHESRALPPEFLNNAIEALEIEYKFWSTRRCSTQCPTLQRYDSSLTSPRPESFAEDVALSTGLTSITEKKALWRNVAAGAERGWDFSSSWLTDKSSLKT